MHNKDDVMADLVQSERFGATLLVELHSPEEGMQFVIVSVWLSRTFFFTAAC
jgi:hypothetical protein